LDEDVGLRRLEDAAEDDAVGCTMCSFSHMKSSMVAMTVISYTHSRTHQTMTVSSAVMSQYTLMTAEYKCHMKLAAKQDAEGCSSSHRRILMVAKTVGPYTHTGTHQTATTYSAVMSQYALMTTE